MKRFKILQAHLVFMMLILSVFLSAGCGSGGSGHWSSDDDTDKAILTYSLNGVDGTVNETAKTISVTMPFGTDVTALVATFTHTGTDVTVGAVTQTSGTTANNFTGPVLYTVTAADSSTAIYTVTVTLAPNSAKAILTYSFVGYSAYPGAVNEAAKTIAVTLPVGTNVTALVATFTHTGTGVKIGAVTQTTGVTANNFTAPKAYTVTAADSSTATYTVTVTVALPLNSAKAIVSYFFNGYSAYPGTINEAAKTIAVTLPFGANLTAQCAIFATTGTGVRIGAVTQTSGTTVNNFTAPVTYRVTAADATFVDYVVTVTLALNSAKAITAYSFLGFAGYPVTINQGTKTIAVTLPVGTDVTNLIATFTTTGVDVSIGAVTQTSGATANDFTAPQTYRVTAADATFVDYVVTVTLSSNVSKAITAYSFVGFAGFPGTIDEAAKTIDVNLPPGTVVTALTANFTTTGVGVTIGVVTQTSGGAPANDFTGPVLYTVTAADSSTAIYTVTVTVTTTTIPDLGSASTFGIAATAGVTNTPLVPLTVISGNVVLDPVAGAICNSVPIDAVGGFGLCGGSPPTINGTVISPLFDLGVTSPTIKADLLAAFLSITPPAGPPAAGSLGGATNIPAGTTLGAVTGSALVLGDNYFTPGVYQSLTSIMITGDLTLDAQGDANARFVFQSSSTVGTAAAVSTALRSRILLVNGAKASNVWWQVGSSATLGAYSEFQGNILASESITMQTGATSCGRLLAGAFTAGAFVFDNNVVSVPGQPFVPPAAVPTYSTVCQ